MANVSENVRNIVSNYVYCIIHSVICFVMKIGSIFICKNIFCICNK